MDVFSTTQTASKISDTTGCEVQPWMIRRLYEDETLPEPARIGNRRVVTRADMPTIIAALRYKGWITDLEEATA